MRKWLILLALLPGAALADPQDGLFVNPQGVVLNISGADTAGFDFTLVAGGTDGGDLCAEGDTYCLGIEGHAEASPKGFTYIDPADDHSRIFFAEVPEGLRILSTIGDLGSGTENRPQKQTLRGVYAPVQTEDAAAADPVTDEALEFFASPTGNIACIFRLGEAVSVRCDMAQLNRSFTQQPVDCGEDWGDSFGIDDTSRRGEVLCHGDTVANPDAQVLDYGSTLGHGGVTCTSAKSGMTCQNNRGHGFTIARKSQSLF